MQRRHSEMLQEPEEYRAAWIRRIMGRQAFEGEHARLRNTSLPLVNAGCWAFESTDYGPTLNSFIQIADHDESSA